MINHYKTKLTMDDQKTTLIDSQEHEELLLAAALAQRESDYEPDALAQTTETARPGHPVLVTTTLRSGKD